MAMVIESGREKAVKLTTGLGQEYYFPAKESPTGNTCLIMQDEHAKAILKLHSDTKEVPKSKWSDIYSKKAEEYQKTREDEAVKKFPDVLGKKDTEDKKTKKRK